MIYVSRRFILQATPLLLTTPLLLEGCAGVSAESVVSALVNNPYKDFTALQTFRKTAKTVIHAADAFNTGLLNIEEALSIKKSAAAKKVANLVAVKQSNLGNGLSTATAISEGNVERSESIKSAIANSDLGKLTPNAIKKVMDAVRNLNIGNNLQVMAGIGGIDFSRKLSTINPANELQALLTGSSGITMTVIQEFPGTVSTFGSNCGKSFEIVAGTQKVNDFTEERKIKKELEETGKRESDKKFAKLSPDNDQLSA